MVGDASNGADQSSQLTYRQLSQLAQLEDQITRLGRLDPTAGEALAEHIYRAYDVGAQRRTVDPRQDGLGDRDRSLSPERDDVWNTLLSTITPDPQPPSVGSSFVGSGPNSQNVADSNPYRSASLYYHDWHCDSGCSDDEGDDPSTDGEDFAWPVGEVGEPEDDDDDEEDGPGQAHRNPNQRPVAVGARQPSPATEPRLPSIYDILMSNLGSDDLNGPRPADHGLAPAEAARHASRDTVRPSNASGVQSERLRAHVYHQGPSYASYADAVRSGIQDWRQGRLPAPREERLRERHQGVRRPEWSYRPRHQRQRSNDYSSRFEEAQCWLHRIILNLTPPDERDGASNRMRLLAARSPPAAGSDGMLESERDSIALGLVADALSLFYGMEPIVTMALDHDHERLGWSTPPEPGTPAAEDSELALEARQLVDELCLVLERLVRREPVGFGWWSIVVTSRHRLLGLLSAQQQQQPQPQSRTADAADAGEAARQPQQTEAQQPAAGTETAASSTAAAEPAPQQRQTAVRATRRPGPSAMWALNTIDGAWHAILGHGLDRRPAMLSALTRRYLGTAGSETGRQVAARA